MPVIPNLGSVQSVTDKLRDAISAQAKVIEAAKQATAQVKQDKQNQSAGNQ